MLNVYQHWDPLKVCVVGRSYPPEFYSWITVPHVRSLFERIAIETEEDYQHIIKKLEEFGVTILRPELPESTFNGNCYLPPPMTPRDYTVMIGDKFYYNETNWTPAFYNDVKDPSWPECSTIKEFLNLPTEIQNECEVQHKMTKLKDNSYKHILEYVQSQGNVVVKNFHDQCHGAMVTRVGKDLYFGTNAYNQDQAKWQAVVDREFTQTRNHIINTGGHSDATYCPVCPGLIVSLEGMNAYKNTFPDWEVVYLPGESWSKITPFLDLKQKNRGKWWIPGFEHDQDVIDTVESWLSHWTGYVEETVFDINMLIVDPKNVIVFNYNKRVFDALEQRGITPHIVPFRHRYFWDGGIHCITSDLHREGTMQDYFADRL